MMANSRVIDALFRLLLTSYLWIAVAGCFDLSSSVNGPYVMQLTFKAEPSADLSEEEHLLAVHKTAILVQKRLLNYGFGSTYIDVQQKEELILVKANGADDPKRIKQLLLQKGQLGFYTVRDDADEILQVINSIDEALQGETQAIENAPNSLTTRHPFSSLFRTDRTIAGRRDLVGYINEADAAYFMKLCKQTTVRQQMPPNAAFLLGHYLTEPERQYSVYFVTTNETPLNEFKKGWIVEAGEKKNMDSESVVELTMNEEVGKLWHKYTSRHIQDAVAITVDERVYSSPIIMEEIAGGKAQISGNFTTPQARDMANILLSEPYLMPLSLVDEKMTKVQ